MRAVPLVAALFASACANRVVLFEDMPVDVAITSAEIPAAELVTWNPGDCGFESLTGPSEFVVGSNPQYEVGLRNLSDVMLNCYLDVEVQGEWSAEVGLVNGGGGPETFGLNPSPNGGLLTDVFEPEVFFATGSDMQFIPGNEYTLTACTWSEGPIGYVPPAGYFRADENETNRCMSLTLVALDP